MWPVPGRARGELPGNHGPGGPYAPSGLCLWWGPCPWKWAATSVPSTGAGVPPGFPWRAWRGSRRYRVIDGRGLLPSPLPFQSLNTPKGQYSCKQHPSLQSHALCQSQSRGQGPRKGLCWAERGPLWVSGELPGQLEEKPLDSWQAGLALLHSLSSQTRSHPPRTTSCSAPCLQAGHPSTVTPGQLQPELPWKPKG